MNLLKKYVVQVKETGYGEEISLVSSIDSYNVYTTDKKDLGSIASFTDYEWAKKVAKLSGGEVKVYRIDVEEVDEHGID